MFVPPKSKVKMTLNAYLPPLALIEDPARRFNFLVAAHKAMPEDVDAAVKQQLESELERLSRTFIN